MTSKSNRRDKLIKWLIDCNGRKIIRERSQIKNVLFFFVCSSSFIACTVTLSHIHIQCIDINELIFCINYYYYIQRTVLTARHKWSMNSNGLGWMQVVTSAKAKFSVELQFHFRAVVWETTNYRHFILCYILLLSWKRHKNRIFVSASNRKSFLTISVADLILIAYFRLSTPYVPIEMFAAFHPLNFRYYYLSLRHKIAPLVILPLRRNFQWRIVFCNVQIE